MELQRLGGRPRYYGAPKRAFDIVFSACALVILALPLTLIALAIVLDSRGPVFFRVRRVGHRGRPLMMLKFRKMRHDARGGPLTLEGDPRLTRVGAVLTRARLDELPQLWDVLRGRMSVIGPRPEAPGFVDLHRGDYAHILTVRPGITGLSQIAYKEEVRIVDGNDPVEDYVARIMPQKLTLDKLYARSVTLSLDLRVIYWTFVTLVLRHPVSVSRATGAMNLRRRPAAPATTTVSLPTGAPTIIVPEIAGFAGARATVADDADSRRGELVDMPVA